MRTGEKMGLFEVGRVCVKIAGRDARKKCVIVDVLNDYNVLIDGETRRRKCNISHLEPIDLMVELSANADNAAVVAALKEQGIVCAEKKDAKKSEKPKPKKEKIKHKKLAATEKKAASVKEEKNVPADKKVAKKDEKKE